MKNKILAMLVAFGMVGSVSAIEINENLSINGFIDGSITKTDKETGGDESNWGLDEVEVNFLFNVGSVSGTVALDSQDIGNSTEDDLEVEQAHFTYTLENGLSVTMGRYGSALGFEREDPSGLYSYSRAYADASGFNLGHIDLGGANVAEGLSIGYAAEAWSIGVSIDNPAGTVRTAGAGTKDDLNFEVALSYTGIENLSVGLGHRKDNQATAAAETDVTNVHAAYVAGKALIAAEYTELSGTTDRTAHMILVDYDVSDKLGVAVRYSTYEESATVDVDKITIAPNYAITESLGAILEYSDISSDAANSDSDLIALELTYTF